MSNQTRTRKAHRKDRSDLSDLQPIILTTDESDEDEEVEEVLAFSLDGADYYIPTKVPFHHSVEAMEMYAQRGEPAAVTYILRTVLGDDGYTALLSYKGLKEKDFNAILATANRIVNASSGKAQ